MEKYVDCHNCQNQYDCERTYLGGCTDGKEWEQEEKKLTDEEIVKALENNAMGYGAGIIGDLYQLTLDLIHRLQDEKKDMHQDLIQAEKYAEKLSIGNARQKAEIERLTERETFFENAWKTSLESTQTVEIALKANRAREEELQKQVDELKEEKLSAVCDLNMRIVELDNELKQAVKDTVKEILTELIERAHSNGCIDLTVNEVKAWFREDYGVEV